MFAIGYCTHIPDHRPLRIAIPSSKTFQYNTDFLFGGILAPGGSTDISNGLFRALFVCLHRFLFRLTMG